MFTVNVIMTSVYYKWLQKDASFTLSLQTIDVILVSILNLLVYILDTEERPTAGALCMLHLFFCLFSFCINI